MLCYAIIVTYNGLKWIDKCLDSLFNSTISLNVIVIDNGSNDGTLECIRRNFPKVEIVKTYQNLGFGKANNVGIKKAYDAGADYIFLLNQDTWVEPAVVEKLVGAAERHPEFGIISPVHLNGEGNALDYGFLHCLCGSKKRNYLSDFYLKSNEELAEIYQTDFINGAFWLLPRKTIEIVGGFNPFFFQYGEDRDYVNRCSYFDLKIGFVSLANAYHDRIQRDSETKNKIIARVLFLVKLFDPRENITVNAQIVALMKSILKGFLTFRFRQVRYYIDELKYYCSNRKQINLISSRLKVAGLTFLD